MLQTVGQILLAILVAVLGFAVVVAVCVVILRLLMVVLPGREEGSGPGAEGEDQQTDAALTEEDPTGAEQPHHRRSAAG